VTEAAGHQPPVQRSHSAPAPGHPRTEPHGESSLQFSVVIPAFNESRRLPPYLEEVVGFFEGRGESWECVVVDDGSTDGTADVVRSVSERCPAVRALVLAPPNRGKGGAVRAGMLSAAGRFRLFTDADGATPIAELKRLEPALLSGADVVIGSRALPDASVSVHSLPHRRRAGRAFNRLVAAVGLRGIADSQCGFKAFSARAAQSLFGALKTQGFGFDVELLLRAQAAGYRVIEVAVNWNDQSGSKVGVLKDGPRMLGQVLVAAARIRFGR
jgi:dolichyl-phosphate beta-glucosyltransferase